MNNTDMLTRERYRCLDLPKEGKSEVWFRRRGDQIEFHHASKHSGQGSSGNSRWIVCSHHACTGEALNSGGNCFAHSQPELRLKFLEQAVSKKYLSLNGTSVSQKLWDEIIQSKIFVDGCPVVPISLQGCEISAEILFSEKQFQHQINFTGSSIFGRLEFRDCLFFQSFWAQRVLYDTAPPSFYQCTFNQDVDISYSIVQNVNLSFQSCNFKQSFKANGMCGHAFSFNECKLAGSASFTNAKIHMNLSGSRFDGAIDVSESKFSGFNGERISLRNANRLGPFEAESIYVERADFGSRIIVEARGRTINFAKATFQQGGIIVADKAELYLEQVRLGGPLRVSGIMDSEHKPQLISLKNADAGRMSFAHIDLSRCSFQGAHGLGTVELESTVSMARAPWWAGRRRFIADEFAWRSIVGRFHSFGWNLAGVHVGVSLPQPTQFKVRPAHLLPLEAAEVASIYRDLRRSLEARSDMSGAADFYYGEMEMRRWNTDHRPLERLLVWSYWLFSGYGLRPCRSFVAWVVLVMIGAMGLDHVGFITPVELQESILTAIRATIPGLTTQLTNLTWAGKWIDTGLRLFGTILIALLLMSVRSIVMRKPSE